MTWALMPSSTCRSAGRSAGASKASRQGRDGVPPARWASRAVEVELGERDVPAARPTPGPRRPRGRPPCRPRAWCAGRCRGTRAGAPARGSARRVAPAWSATTESMVPIMVRRYAVEPPSSVWCALGAGRLQLVVQVLADAPVGARDEEEHRADQCDHEHHQQRDPVDVEVGARTSRARWAGPRSPASARGRPTAMTATVMPQRPRVKRPSGTQPRDRAIDRRDHRHQERQVDAADAERHERDQRVDATGVGDEEDVLVLGRARRTPAA